MSISNSEHRVCPTELAGVLDHSLRRFIHNPQKILAGLIREGMKVLDIGCGPGYFTLSLAKLVGSNGAVFAADLQQEMLNKIQDKISGTELEKIIRIHKTGNDTIGLLEKVDFVFAFYMVHEVPDKEKFIHEIRAILIPGGKMLLVEPLAHVSKKDFQHTLEIAEQAGFRKTGEIKIFFSRTALLE